MVQINQFPERSEDFLRKGHQARRQAKFDQALEYYQKSYQLEPTVRGFEEIIDLAFHLEDNQTLKEYWQNYAPSIEEFHDHEGVFFLWLESIDRIYPLSRAIDILSQQMIILTQLESPQVGKIQQALQSRISLKNQLSQIQTDDVQQIRSFLADFLTKPRQDLLDLLQKVYQYGASPLFYQEILKEPKIENFIKTDVLHHLINLDWDFPVELSWFNETKHVMPSQLTVYSKQTAYQDNLNALENYFNRENPIFYDEAIDLFRLHYLCLYPYAEEILNPAKAWLNYFLKHYLYMRNRPVPDHLDQYIQQAEVELQNIFHSEY
ncbi:hypothetical protein SAMN04488558_101376 [Ignavigranum ruoffiae]|uniref:Uncharacterized protein n=2 Tax=Ignavigranum ruoffiae TaxID=89093 RepID=A0A1H8ZZ53_9LACT|nr:hypothetical protein [Ignavigranum ruoffiae]UPQ85693.1 hypothetical protein M0R79_08585 [Ignavigranum ruoffiae]SEP69766.1 hypothetical protein SAMN04488558_101376 [Ignavigranum ruoffiae]